MSTHIKAGEGWMLCTLVRGGFCFNRVRYVSGGGLWLKGQRRRREANSHNKTPFQSPTENRDNTENPGWTGRNWFLSPRTHWSPAVNDLCWREHHFLCVLACIIEWVCDEETALPASQSAVTDSLISAQEMLPRYWLLMPCYLPSLRKYRAHLPMQI